MTPPRLCVFRTDSSYCINTLLYWHQDWRRRAKSGLWRNSSGKVILHQPIIESILHETKDQRVFYRYVKAHNGEIYNEMADKLAVQVIIQFLLSSGNIIKNKKIPYSYLGSKGTRGHAREGKESHG